MIPTKRPTWRDGLKPATAMAVVVGLIGLFGPTGPRTEMGHNLLAVGGAGFWFIVVLVGYRFRILRDAKPTRGTSRWAYVALGILMLLALIYSLQS